MKFITGFTLALILALCPLSVSAQEADKAEDTTSVAAMRLANGTRIGAWTVNCEAIAVNETACVLSQRLVRTSDNVFLAELLAFWSGDVKRTYLAARVPNGVFFPSGFALKPADGDERKEFVWQSCSRDICEALLEADLDSLDKLSKAEQIIAGYRPNLRSKPVVFRLSLNGLREGLEALKASMDAADKN